MGISAAESMTPTPRPSTPTKTGIWLTQFPVSALTDLTGRAVDWSDHKAAHKAVSRLFAPRLAGDRDARRSTNGILFRRDAVGDETTILVQSLVPPELTPANSRSTEMSLERWRCETAEQVLFRVAVNAVKRTSRYFADPSKVKADELGPERSAGAKRHRKDTASVVPSAEIDAWIARKLAVGLKIDTIHTHYRDTTHSGPHHVVVDVFEGVATVTDPEELDRLRIEGVGRSKAFGCGLLSIIRTGP